MVSIVLSISSGTPKASLITCFSILLELPIIAPPKALGPAPIPTKGVPATAPKTAPPAAPEIPDIMIRCPAGLSTSRLAGRPSNHKLLS